MTAPPGTPGPPAPPGDDGAAPSHRPTVGVLGTGRLGRALATRLAAVPDGPRLAVADRDREPATALGRELAVPALPPARLAAHCAVVLVCVPPPAVAGAIAACRTGAPSGPGTVFANLATSLPTAALRADPALRGTTVVGLKPVCQFTAVAHGVPTPFLTAATGHLALLRSAVGTVGPVLPVDERAEDAVGAVNRAATRAALRACTALRRELTALTAESAVIDAAVRNVLAGTALDFPPEEANPYTAALLRELAATDGATATDGTATDGATAPDGTATAINTPATEPRSVGGTGHPAARP